MQMVKKIFFIFLLLWFALILFMPKQELYFALERIIAEQGIKINEKTIEEGTFGLQLKGITVYAKGIKVATAEQVSLVTLLFYNRIDIENLHTDKGLKSIVSLSLDHIVLSYSIVDPMHVYFSANGSTGEYKGSISLREHKAYFEQIEEKGQGTLKSFLKKDKQGWYYGF